MSVLAFTLANVIILHHLIGLATEVGDTKSWGNLSGPEPCTTLEYLDRFLEDCNGHPKFRPGNDIYSYGIGKVSVD